jgi:hypothetical protein
MRPRLPGPPIVLLLRAVLFMLESTCCLDAERAAVLFDRVLGEVVAHRIFILPIKQVVNTGRKPVLVKQNPTGLYLAADRPRTGDIPVDGDTAGKRGLLVVKEVLPVYS